jgi:hypothetical protein
MLCISAHVDKVPINNGFVQFYEPLTNVILAESKRTVYEQNLPDLTGGIIGAGFNPVRIVFVVDGEMD